MFLTLCILLSLEYIEYRNYCNRVFIIHIIKGMFLCGTKDLIIMFVTSKLFILCSNLVSGYIKKVTQSNDTTKKYLLMDWLSSSFSVHSFFYLYDSTSKY